MIRFLFTMLFYVVVGRWMYAEVQMLCPWVAPAIDRVLATVQIPTHDSWNNANVQSAIDRMTTAFNRVGDSVSLAKDEGFGPALEDLRASFIQAKNETGPRVHSVNIINARRL